MKQQTHRDSSGHFTGHFTGDYEAVAQATGSARPIVVVRGVWRDLQPCAAPPDSNDATSNNQPHHRQAQLPRVWTQQPARDGENQTLLVEVTVHDARIAALVVEPLMDDGNVARGHVHGVLTGRIGHRKNPWWWWLLWLLFIAVVLALLAALLQRTIAAPTTPSAQTTQSPSTDDDSRGGGAPRNSGGGAGAGAGGAGAGAGSGQNAAVNGDNHAKGGAGGGGAGTGQNTGADGGDSNGGSGVENGAGGRDGSVGAHVDGASDATSVRSDGPADGGQPAWRARQRSTLTAALADPAAFFARGCGQDVTLDNDVLFDHDRDQLKASALPVLRQLQRLLRQAPDAQLTIAVEGHADPSGREAHNLTLSKRRAKRVAAWLVKAGAVSPARVSAIGRGESQPLIDAPPNDPRQRENRRVSIHVACPGDAGR